MSTWPYYHNKEDHTEISAARLADLFGCVDGSYADTVSTYNTELVDLQESFELDSTNSSTSDHLSVEKRMKDITRALDALLCHAGREGKPHLALSEFCHLHLPAFMEAFRATVRFDGDRPFQCLADELGPDEHVWTLLYLIVKDPLFCRYLREHPGGPTFPLDAMASMSLILRKWTICLEEDRDWDEALCRPLLYAVPALTSLLVATLPASCSSPSPIAIIDTPIARNLLKDTEAYCELLYEPPPKLGKKVTEQIERLESDVTSLKMCLENDLQECKDDKCVHRVLPWGRCEGRSKLSGKGCKAGGELLMCSRCRTVRYCSREHQKSHWKIHKATCREPIW